VDVWKTERKHVVLEAVECIYVFIASNTTGECRREGKREPGGTGCPRLLKEKNTARYKAAWAHHNILLNKCIFASSSGLMAQGCIPMLHFQVVPFPRQHSQSCNNPPHLPASLHLHG
jgi:hypothetical protein